MQYSPIPLMTEPEYKPHRLEPETGLSISHLLIKYYNMKYLLFLLISIPGLAQSDTTKNILLNKDTLLTIKTVVNKTASVSYSETSVVQIVKPFKSVDTIVTPPPII